MYLFIIYIIILSISFTITITANDVTVNIKNITIPTVNYFPYIYNCGGKFLKYKLPCLNLSEVNFSDVIDKDHVSIELESEFIKVVILPAMGRVYSIKYKPTGHEVLWKNDIARPGGANNDLGWWLWIGGIEYTLPGEEHGYTWALDWDWKIVNDIDDNNNNNPVVITTVIEPTTGVKEELKFQIRPANLAALTTFVDIHNPSLTFEAHFAHWTNVPMVPGGLNQLTDNTEFFVPTKLISVAKRWEQNLGPHIQSWETCPLRFIKNWVNGTRMGDFMAKNMTDGFFGAYSHDSNEGVVRVFDITKTPGLDTWTYGFHPNHTVPMGSGKNSNGYAEMWGGNVRNFPDEKATLGVNQSVSWIESVYAFHQTSGISFSNSLFTSYATIENISLGNNLKQKQQKVNLSLCPTTIFKKGSIMIKIVEKKNNKNIVLANRKINTGITPQSVLQNEIFNIILNDDDSIIEIIVYSNKYDGGYLFKEIGRFEPNVS